MSSLIGVWVANNEKSQRHGNHRFQSGTLAFKALGEKISLRHSGVNMAGKEESGTTVFCADGAKHPLSAEEPGVTVVARLSAQAFETEARTRRMRPANLFCK